MEYLSDLFLFVFVFCLLNIMREGFLFYKDLKLDKQHIIGNKRLIELGFSISYAITYILG